MAEGWHRGTALPLPGSMRGYRLKMRKGMPGGRSRGGSGVRGGPGGGNLRPRAGGLAFRRYWETSGGGELLLRWIPRRQDHGGRQRRLGDRQRVLRCARRTSASASGLIRSITERIAGRMVGRIVLGQPDRDQRVVAKGLRRDRRRSVRRRPSRRSEDCSKRALRRLLG
jgi:hypothetical protein